MIDMPKVERGKKGNDEGGIALDQVLIAWAKEFVQEYQKYGFYRNMSPQEEEEAADKLARGIVQNEGWFPDWILVNDERNTYWFDSEWTGDLEHMFSEFLTELCKVTLGELKFENIREHIVLERDKGPSWVEFDWMGRKHHIDARGLGDYIDYKSLVSYINDQLEKAGNPRRFVHLFNTVDQNAMLAFLRLEDLQRLQKEKGWPADTDNTQLFAPVKRQPARPPSRKKGSSVESKSKKK